MRPGGGGGAGCVRGGVPFVGMEPVTVPSERRYVSARAPYDVCLMRSASPMGSASLTATISASTTDFAVRPAMTRAEAAVAFPLAEALGMLVLSAASSVLAPCPPDARALAERSRNPSASRRMRRPASSHEDGGRGSMVAPTQMASQSAAAWMARPSASPRKNASGGGFPAATVMAAASSASLLPKALAMAWTTSRGERCSDPGMRRPPKVAPIGGGAVGPGAGGRADGAGGVQPDARRAATSPTTA